MKTVAIAFAALLVLASIRGSCGERYSFQPLHKPIQRFRPIQPGKLRPSPIPVEKRKYANSDRAKANANRELQSLVERQKNAARRLEGADASKMLRGGDVSKLLNDPRLPKGERARIENAYREMADTMKRRGSKMRLELEKNEKQ